MNSTKLGLRISGVVFAIICLAHVVRLSTKTEVIVAHFVVPAWVSTAGAIVMGLLAIWTWRLTFPSPSAGDARPTP